MELEVLIQPGFCHPERSEGSQAGSMPGAMQYYVYILSNSSKVLYTGVTSDLLRRVEEHRRKLIPGFTSRYNLHRLVYYEQTQDVRSAIAREKQLKSWSRAKKVALIEEANRSRRDSTQDWI